MTSAPQTGVSGGLYLNGISEKGNTAGELISSRGPTGAMLPFSASFGVN